MQGGKAFLIWALGFVAILLAAFLFNVTVGILLITIVLFILMNPILKAFSSKTPVDTFVNATISEIDAIPEVIEHVEEKVHEEVEIVKQEVSKLWYHHHKEVEAIGSELSQLSSSKKI